MGAHECEEQWRARNMRVYTGLSLREEKKPYIMCVSIYYDSLGYDPLYPSFYSLGGRVYNEDPGRL
jgi:hypothetical protein